MSNLVRGLVGGVATLGVLGAGIGLYAAQAPERAAGQIFVDDSAGVMDETALVEGIEGVRFHEPTDVAVYTHVSDPDPLIRYSSRALNDGVLAHARESRTEWLSEDERKWADDLFIFAVDPEGRLVGTYFGENRAVSDATQLDIQDAAKDDLRAGRWTEGAIRSVEEAADRMNAPFMRTGGGIAVVAGGTLLTMSGAGAWLAVGLRRARRSRAARAEGDELMASVVRDQGTTERHARRIPTGAGYGRLMLQRYEEYKQGVRELTDADNPARAVRERDHDKAASLEVLTAYRDKAQELHDLGDVIADTATLLNRDEGWVEAWRRQESPVRADLEAVGPMLAHRLRKSEGRLPEAQTLRDSTAAALDRLDELRDELESQATTPDAALAELRTMRDELSARLDRLSTAVVDTYGGSRRTTMRDAMTAERRPMRREPTIIGTAHPGYSWYGVASFAAGYHEGTSRVERANSSSSSSGGVTSGYTASSSGGFSGSGSSSRF